MRFENGKGYKNTMIISSNQEECSKFIPKNVTFLTGNSDTSNMRHSEFYTSLTDSYNFTWDDITGVFNTFKNSTHTISNPRELVDKYNEFVNKLLSHIGKVDFIYIPVDTMLFRFLNIRGIPFALVSSSNYIHDTGVIKYMDKTAKFFSLDIYKDSILEKILISKESDTETYCYDINLVYPDLTQDTEDNVKDEEESKVVSQNNFTSAYSFGSSVHNSHNTSEI